MNRTRTTIAALAILVAACGGDESVGSDAAFQFDQDQIEDITGETTTTVVAAETTTTAVAAETTTTAAVAQTTTTLPPEQQAVSVEVQILDNSPYFSPNAISVPVGGVIRFVNAGSGTFTVLHDGGMFKSPALAPGEVWIYDAVTPGQFNYSDEGRPFAVGVFEVVG